MIIDNNYAQTEFFKCMHTGRTQARNDIELTNITVFIPQVGTLPRLEKKMCKSQTKTSHQGSKL